MLPFVSNTCPVYVCAGTSLLPLNSSSTRAHSTESPWCSLWMSWIGHGNVVLIYTTSRTALECWHLSIVNFLSFNNFAISALQVHFMSQPQTSRVSWALCFPCSSLLMPLLDGSEGMLAWFHLEFCPILRADSLCTGAEAASLMCAGRQGWSWVSLFPGELFHWVSLWGSFWEVALCRRLGTSTTASFVSAPKGNTLCSLVLSGHTVLEEEKQLGLNPEPFGSSGLELTAAGLVHACRDGTSRRISSGCSFVSPFN